MEFNNDEDLLKRRADAEDKQDISLRHEEEPPIPEPYRSAHKQSFRSREKLEASRWVGCFYCTTVYAPKLIKEWIDNNQTAICPICGIDSVMPLTVEQFDSDFLERMAPLLVRDRHVPQRSDCSIRMHDDTL